MVWKKRKQIFLKVHQEQTFGDQNSSSINKISKVKDIQYKIIKLEKKSPKEDSLDYPLAFVK